MTECYYSDCNFTPIIITELYGSWCGYHQYYAAYFAHQRKDKCCVHKCSQYKRLMYIPSFGKYCKYHYKECFAKLNLGDKPPIQQCDFACCNKSSKLVKTNDGYYCVNHVGKPANFRSGCDFSGCNKSSKLVKTNSGHYCANHVGKPANFCPYCDFPNCEKITKITITAKGQYCEKHYQLMLATQLVSNKSHYNVEFKDPPIIPSNKSPDIPVMANSTNNTVEASDIPIIVAENTNESQIIISNATVESSSIPIITANNTVESKIKPYKIALCQPIKTIKVKDPHAETCHAEDCNIDQNLVSKFKGQWCISHFNVISRLRNVIKEHKANYSELIARLRELQLRKDFDKPHLDYTLKLMNSFSKSVIAKKLLDDLYEKRRI